MEGTKVKYLCIEIWEAKKFISLLKYLGGQIETPSASVNIKFSKWMNKKWTEHTGLQESNLPKFSFKKSSQEFVKNYCKSYHEKM